MNNGLDYGWGPEFDSGNISVHELMRIALTCCQHDNTMQPVLYDKKRASELLGISNTQLGRLMRAGKIFPVMIESKPMFSPDEIKRFATHLPSWEPR